MSRAAKARKERERLNLPLALRKTRREAAVKGCRKVTSLVVGDSSGGDGSSSGELSSSGDGDSDASCSDQAIDNEEEISLPRKRSRHHGGGGGNSSSNSNGREGRGGGRSSSKHKGAKGSSSRSSRSRVSSCGGGGGNTSRGKGVSRLLPKNKQERRLYQKYARTTAKISRLRACSSPSDASSAADGDSNSTRGGVAGGAGGRWSCSARRRSSLSSLTLGGSNASDKMRPKHLSGLSVDGYPPIRRYSESNGEFDPFRLIRSEAAAADRIEYSGRSGLYGGSGSSMENPAHSRRREVGWNRDYGPGAFSGEMRGYKRSFHEHGRGSGDHRDWRNSDVTKFSSGDCGRRGEGERRQSLHSMFPGAVLQVGGILVVGCVFFFSDLVFPFLFAASGVSSLVFSWILFRLSCSFFYSYFVSLSSTTPFKTCIRQKLVSPYVCATIALFSRCPMMTSTTALGTAEREV